MISFMNVNYLYKISPIIKIALMFVKIEFFS